ncbi:hypothetical protein [Streptomyces litchfieldiae]|uniref:Uncharacterized protein n=1 Tax=Streptomyces litchfieldiae TaxID=3075543 RepID=A0ABU2N155_9ACTN|nr:hypothetical protein [Streptomyces sp. DSM 44938]MDT0347642.1 hypothetical protein [Streptomyces sp. DSM 44938]
MTERVFLDAVGEDGRTGAVRIDFSTRPPYALEVRRGTVESSTTYEAKDLFAALIDLRLALEAEGLLLCCQGARGDVTSSGMERQAGGRHVFPFSPDTREIRRDSVDIFAPAAPDEVVTVEEQRRAIFALHGLPDPASGTFQK